VEFNGRKVQAMAMQNRVMRQGKVESPIHLSTVRRGRMMAGMPEEWIMDSFKLNTKGQLVDGGVPRSLTDDEYAQFMANFQGE
jgi:hypothetical protein